MIATLLILFFMFFYLLAQFKAGSKIMTTLLQDVPVYQHRRSCGRRDRRPAVGWRRGAGLRALPAGLLLFRDRIYGIWRISCGGMDRCHAGRRYGCGVIILLILTLGQVGGLSKATEQLKEMTPPENGTGFITLGQSADEDTTLPKGTWLRLTDGGIARLAEQVRLAKGKTETEAKLLRITTPAEVERIEPTQLGFAVSTSFTPAEANGYGAGRKGVYVSAPGPHRIRRTASSTSGWR